MDSLVQVESVFRFKDCAEHGIGFVFYEIFAFPNFHCTVGAKKWTEDTIISTCSHEAIEMLLAVLMAIDKEDYAIHRVIGYHEEVCDEDDIILTDEHYANNVDGLPNLPHPLEEKDDD